MVFVETKSDSRFLRKKSTLFDLNDVTAETTQNAMVVAVATRPNYRNKGYASLLMKTLMSIYFHEKKKSLCLFYDNPKAGAIYHRLGFVTIGTWDMYHQEKTT